MQLIKVTAKNYTRFHLNTKLKHFTLTMDKSVIVVAGDNGSGKSSLCNVMFPWPVDRVTLAESGYVTRIWEHAGQTYEDSIINGLYSFCINGGENLNIAGGIRVQESLFTEHFGVDIQLMRMLTGQIKFTTMSPKMRQYWLSRMDNYELDKLEQVVKVAKEDKKEVEILLRYQQSQLGKYNIDCNIHELTQLAADYRDKLDVLSKLRFPAVDNKSLSDLITAVKTTRKLLTSYQAEYRAGQQLDLPEQLQSLHTTWVGLNTTRDQCVNRLMELGTVDISVDGIPSVADCTSIINNLKSRIKPVNPAYVAPELHKMYLYVSANIHGCFADLADLTYMPVQQYESLCSRITEVTQQLKQLDTQIYQYTATIDGIKEDLLHPITCPECTHVFGKRGSHKDLTMLEDRLTAVTVTRTNLHQTYSDLHATAQSVVRYTQVFAALTSYLNNWSTQYAKEVLHHSPSIERMKLCLSEIVAQLHHSVQNDEINVELRKYTEYLHIHEMYHSQQVELQHKERDTLTAQIEAVDIQMHELEVRRGKLERQLHLRNLIATSKELLSVLGKDIVSGLENMSTGAMDKAVSASVLELRSGLAQLDSQISMYDANKRHHESVSSEIASQQTKLSTINEVIACLDGRNGFIGKLYKQRLKEHVHSLNQILEKLWNYDLVVTIPPEAMTFRFPLVVEGMDRSDVSEGSKGMQEVIDLAFILLVREYCNVTHLPLILDEFGSALDATHLDRAFTYLHGYKVDQIALVSHLTELMHLYDDTQATYVVLSDRHLDKTAMPACVNECLEFH